MREKKEKLWTGVFKLDEVHISIHQEYPWACRYEIMGRVGERWFFFDDVYIWNLQDKSEEARSLYARELMRLHVWQSKHYGYVMNLEHYRYRAKANYYTPKFKCYSSMIEIQKERMQKKLVEGA